MQLSSKDIGYTRRELEQMGYKIIEHKNCINCFRANRNPTNHSIECDTPDICGNKEYILVKEEE